MAEQTVICRIVLEQPVAGVAYGLQSGSGHSYEILQKQVARSGELVFEFPVPVKRSKEGNMVLYGPIIQGPSGTRFLYLNLGNYAGQHNALVNGRIKVPVPTSPDDIIAATNNGGLFVTKISGTKAKDGRPVMGTIKPFDGWELT